jgi:hypothetical protein
VTPILFLVVVGYLLVNAFVTAPVQAFTGIGLILLGLPFYWYWTKDEGRGTKGEGGAVGRDAGAPQQWAD